MLRIPPYFPPEEIYKRVGTEWTTTKTYIEYLLFHNIENEIVDGSQYEVVIKKGNKVILSTIYDLNELPVIFKLDNYKFTSSNSMFRVSITKQYNEEQIKELTISN